MNSETDGWIDAGKVGGLRNALDLLPATGGRVYLPAGTYEIRETVTKQLAEGRHLITANRIVGCTGAAFDIQAPGCVVAQNLVDP